MVVETYVSDEKVELVLMAAQGAKVVVPEKDA